LYCLQIEFLVDTLRKQTDERILVLIPQTYVNKVVPNSAKNRGGQKFSQITADDQVLPTVQPQMSLCLM
jgi:hypothetical protein